MKTNKIKKKNDNKENIIYIISIILMLIPIVLVIINPGSVGTEVRTVTSGGWGPFNFGAQKGSEIVNVVHESPFGWDGLAAIFGCVLYTIVLMRNKNTLYQFNKNSLDFRILFLHFLNLIFLISAMSLFTKNNWNIFGLSPAYFMILAILFSALSMKTISGYMWIVAIIIAMFNIDVFNKWQGYSTIYVVSAYSSLICQTLILNIFDFDINALINDIATPGRKIKGNINAAIDTTTEGVKKIGSVASAHAQKTIEAKNEAVGIPANKFNK